jgi:hypothetical protein
MTRSQSIANVCPGIGNSFNILSGRAGDVAQWYRVFLPSARPWIQSARPWIQSPITPKKRKNKNVHEIQLR